MSKKILMVALIVAILTIGVLVLTGCDKVEEENVVTNSQKEEPKSTKDTSEENEKMYGEVMKNYEKALKEYDLDNFEDEEIEEKYNIKDTTLLMHITRYSSNGVKLTKAFYDIDKNGIDELILGAENAPAVIYSFDKKANKPVFVFALDTLERGNMVIYDNGIIHSGGAGGAALHIYEFGKIAEDGVSYKMLESIEEEYIEDNEVPEYRDAKSGKKLDYESINDVFTKYITDAVEVNVFED